MKSEMPKNEQNWSEEYAQTFVTVGLIVIY